MSAGRGGWHTQGPPFPPGRGRLLWGLRVVALALVSAAVLILPCFLFLLGFERFTGRQASIWLLFGIASLWLFLIFNVLQIFSHRARRRLERDRNPRNMFDEVMDALDRIAGGDYDISIQKQGQYHYSELADKVNKLAKDLQSMEQMRQEFVSNVSHEIQSPLTSIRGFAALLKKEDIPTDQRLHYAEVIETESKRLAGLSDNLLRLSVLDSDQSPFAPQAFRLDKQLEEILLLLEPQWSAKGIELDISLEKVVLCGDADLLSQVWINLLHNAVKFTPPGGRIAVSLAQADCGTVCTISDTGAGMPEESLLHIFERFYKVDKARDRSIGGNGLGLSLVKKIVDLHSGQVAVNSAPGEGSTFTVTLPGTQ